MIPLSMLHHILKHENKNATKANYFCFKLYSSILISLFSYSAAPVIRCNEDKFQANGVGDKVTVECIISARPPLIGAEWVYFNDGTKIGANEEKPLLGLKSSVSTPKFNLSTTVRANVVYC